MRTGCCRAGRAAQLLFEELEMARLPEKVGLVGGEQIDGDLHLRAGDSPLFSSLKYWAKLPRP